METDTLINQDKIVVESISQKADDLISKSTAKTSAIASIPVPLVDIAGMTYLQYNLIESLSELHNRPVDNKTALLFAASLSALISKLLSEIVDIIAKEVGLENILSETVVKASVAGLMTTISGEIFNNHLQNGGSIDDLSFNDIKIYIADQLNSERLSLSGLTPNFFDSIADKFNSL